MPTCGYCKLEGQSIDHIRGCAKQAHPSARKSPAAARRQRQRTFGDDLRAHDAKREAEAVSKLQAKLGAVEIPTCWGCDSTNVSFVSLNGKTLRTCPRHPKTVHPDFKRSTT